MHAKFVLVGLFVVEWTKLFTLPSYDILHKLTSCENKHNYIFVSILFSEVRKKLSKFTDQYFKPRSLHSHLDQVSSVGFQMDDLLRQMVGHVHHGRIQRGGGGRGPDPRPPEKSQKYMFLSNTGPDPLKNHKATKPAFNVGPSSAHQRNAI